MKYFPVLLLAVLLYSVTGCDDDVIGTGGGAVTGQITLNIPGHPPEVENLRTLLTREPAETLRSTILLPTLSRPVVAAIVNVPADTWRLRLDGVAPNGTVLYTGDADIVVPADSAVGAGLLFVQLRGEIIIVTRPDSAGCVPVPHGLVSWWPGEESPDDVAGGNAGKPGWPGLSYVDGRVGRAFRFDGVSGQVRVPDNPNLRITGSLTIEGWIRAEGYPVDRASGQILFRGDDRPGIDPYFLTMLPDGKLLFRISSTTAYADLQTPAPVEAGEWRHVAAVLDSATGAMTIYLDGDVAASMTTGLRPFRDLDSSHNPGLGIGNTQSGDLYHDQPFHGAIDELSIYRVALGPAMVRGIFLAGSTGKCRPR
jgi:hypothetical protein